MLEYVEGTNLFRLVKERGPLPVALAANYVRQAATGLAYLHSRGIIHRDVKPANLILADDGTVKLLDMGLVRFASAEDLSCAEMDQELTQAGIVIGTVAYMSPEQALDTRSADQRSDIYSLGCTLFFLLTGRSLYHEETGMKTLLAHREQPVPTIRQYCEEAPVSLDAVFRTMVAKRPADRLQSMTEVVAALDACVPGLATNSPAPPAQRRLASGALPVPAALARGWKRLKSSPLRIALAVAVIAGLATGGTYLAGILIQIKSNRGTTEVRVDDPDAEVTVKRFGSTAKGPPPQSPRETKTSDFPPATVIGTKTLDSASESGDRRLAVWLLTLGTAVGTADGSVIETLAGIPNSPFRVTSISFEANKQFDDSLLSEFVALHPSHLRQLSLQGTGITDKGMEAMANIPRLLDLNLSETQVTDEGVKRLGSAAQLQQLKLSQTRITDKALGFLAAMRSLTDLTLDQTQITDEGLMHIPQLKNLSLDGTRITDAGLKHLENQTWLRFLSLWSTRVTKEGVAKLEAALPSCDIKHEPWEPTKEQPKAQTKKQATSPHQPPRQPGAPGHTSAPPSVDRQVANWALFFPAHNLWLREIPQRPVQMPSQLPQGDIHLEGITFRGPMNLANSDIDRLASLPDLKCLNLQSPSVTDDSVRRLAALKHLTRLSVADGYVTDASLPALAGIQRLSSLDLSRTQITDAGLEQLAKCKSLNDPSLAPEFMRAGTDWRFDVMGHPLPSLIVDNTRTTEAELLKLQQALPNCAIFAWHIYPGPGNGHTLLPLPPRVGSSDRSWANWLLDHTALRCRVFTDVDPETAVTRVQDLPPIDFHIQKLSFDALSAGLVSDLNSFLFRRLGELPGLRELQIDQRLPRDTLQSLSAIKSLQRLRIGGDPYAGDGRIRALSGLTGLTALTFEGTEITDAGVRSLAPLTRLTELSLSGHARNLHGSGFEALRGLTNLRALDMTGCGLDDEGARGIEVLTSLESLSVRDTWISGKGLAALAGLKHLKFLNLAHCRRLRTDDLAPLSELSSLEQLDLSNCRLTAASSKTLLDTLKKLKNLRTLNLMGTGVPPGHVAPGLPQLKVTEEQPLPIPSMR